MILKPMKLNVKIVRLIFDRLVIRRPDCYEQGLTAMNRFFARAFPRILYPFVATTVLAASVQAQEPAQSLNLFRAVESQQTPATEQFTASRPVESRMSGPQFTLVGTSRFGDRQRARIRSRSGEVIAVNIDASGSSPIPGYPGYQITDGGSRQLVVQHPTNAPCVEAADQGVSCSGPNVTRLQLATAEPIQRAPEPERRNGRNAQGDADSASTNMSTDDDATAQNPFAAALRAARERGEVDPAVMRAEAERFRPRRIDPSEVPEGARVIRTPFGDRIVQDQQ